MKYSSNRSQNEHSVRMMNNSALAFLFSNRNQMKTCFLFTFLFALCAHAYCWLNALYGHDSLLIFQNDWTHQILLGRPLQEIYVSFRGNIVAPWLIGILGTIYLGFANWAIVKLLNIRTGAFIALTCGALSTCATITLCNATYLLDYDIYMLSFMLACWALYAVLSMKKIGFAIGALLLCFSLGLYPAFLQSYVALALVVCMLSFLRNTTKDSFVLALRVALACTAGFVLYAILFITVRTVANLDPSSASNSVSAAFSFAENGILEAFIHAWIDPVNYLIFPETHAVHVIGFINLLLIVFAIWAVLRVGIVQKASKHQIICAIVCLFILPLGSDCVNFAAYGFVHSLMIMSFFLLYPLVFALAEELLNKTSKPQSKGTALWGKLILSTLVFLTIISNTIYANQVYTKKDLEYQATFSTLTRLEARLESLEGYTPGTTPVVLEGSLSNNSFFNAIRTGFPPDHNQLPDKGGHYSDYAVGLNSQVSLYTNGQIKQYYEFILGCPINIVSVQEALLEDLDYSATEMPSFPLNGSVVMKDGVVIVRLS